jgi:hypothetical protein
MSFKKGTATDHVDLLEQLIAFATGRGVDAVAVNAAGTLYTVGNILTAVGGTFSSAATFEVTSVNGGGGITGIRVVESGTYTVDPTNPDTPTGGTGSGATLNYTMADAGWSLSRESFYAVSATPGAPGTSYLVGQQLEVVGGTSVETAVFQVATINGGGGVTSVVPTSRIGEYTVSPANAAATTGGSGSGATLNVVYTPNRWAILEGVGSGSDQIFVGIRTFTDSGANNWEIAGMAGYQSGERYIFQPGISPGRYEVPDHGHYVPLNNSTIDYWFFVTGRRIIVVAKMGTTYSSCYLGFLNQYGTSNEYPYPLCVASPSSLFNRVFSSASASFSGIIDPIGHVLVPDAGPISVRDPGGSWIQFMNSALSGGGRTLRDSAVVYPAGLATLSGVADVDKFGVGLLVPTGIIPNENIPGTQTFSILQTPDSPEFSSVLWPATFIEAVPVRQALGELADVYWVSAEGESTDLLAEDTIEISGDLYIVFTQANRTDVWNFMAIRRS